MAFRPLQACIALTLLRFATVACTPACELSAQACFETTDFKASTELSQRFACKDYLNTTVPLEFVLDGSCDCCNCLDEDEATRVKTSAKCDAKSLLSALRSALQSFENGNKKLATMLPKHDVVKQLKKQLREQKTEHTKAAEKAVQAYYKDAGAAQAAQAAGRLTSDIAKRYESSMQAAQQLQQTAQMYDRLSSTDFGRDGRFLTLLDEDCVVSQPLSEKVSKGGSTSTNAKRYAYTLCYFRNVTQKENLPDEWIRQEARDKGQEITSDKPKPKRRKAKKQRATQSVLVDAEGNQVAGDAAELDDASPTLPNRTFTDPHLTGIWRGYLHISQLADHFWAGLTKYPGVEAASSQAAREAGQYAPQPTLTLPKQPRQLHAEAAVSGSKAASTSSAAVDSLSEVAMVFEGTDTCRSEDMVAKRRTYVLHVCPGLLQATIDVNSSSAAAAAGQPQGVAATSDLQAILNLVYPDLPEVFMPTSFNLALAATRRTDSTDVGVRNEDGGSNSGIAAGGDAAASGAAWPRVVHQAENGLCNYVLWVQHPLACPKRVVKTLKHRLDAMEQALRERK